MNLEARRQNSLPTIKFSRDDEASAILDAQKPVFLGHIWPASKTSAKASGLLYIHRRTAATTIKRFFF